jgi:hypothetical protein
VRPGFAAAFLAAGRVTTRFAGVMRNGFAAGFMLMDDAAPRGARDCASAAPPSTQAAATSIAMPKTDRIAMETPARPVGFHPRCGTEGARGQSMA